ncbi:MAG: (Fe-S)-binding protein [Magnetococcales bacterium]|nr:(Fe-S)-binding protein [Magnetococcales bacterium]
MSNVSRTNTKKLSNSAPPRKRWANADLCTHCGYCLPACPTYRVENDERQSPRGRVSIVLALRDSGLEDENAREALSHCLLCRACHTACPVGVRPGKLVVMARSSLPAESHGKGDLFHKITDNHTLTGITATMLKQYRDRGVQGVVRDVGMLKLLGHLKRVEGLIPSRDSETLASDKSLPTLVPQQEKQLTVGLLCGCMARLFLPHVGRQAEEVLEALGCGVQVPEGFGCCGAPYREQGDREQFVRQARRTVEAFRDQGDPDTLDAIICDSSVCAITAKSYAKALSKQEDIAEIAKVFASKVVDFGSFLANRLDELDLSPADPGMGTLTYHDHCQSRHALGTMAEPRRLLKRLPSPFQELPRSDRCCGAGGDYMLRYPVRSANVRNDKLAAIVESEADTVVCANPGCLMNMEAGLRSRQESVQVRHVVEVMHASLTATEMS